MGGLCSIQPAFNPNHLTFINIIEPVFNPNHLTLSNIIEPVLNSIHLTFINIIEPVFNPNHLIFNKMSCTVELKSLKRHVGKYFERIQK